MDIIVLSKYELLKLVDDFFDVFIKFWEDCEFFFLLVSDLVDNLIDCFFFVIFSIG